ncbi:hypothetical protein PSAB6_450164 [Paraburkholderia sabiae]|nr:hypothetical protein PSAB6_450164 [Paraburkholderia sabiae]
MVTGATGTAATGLAMAIDGTEAVEAGAVVTVAAITGAAARATGLCTEREGRATDGPIDARARVFTATRHNECGCSSSQSWGLRYVL